MDDPVPGSGDPSGVDDLAAEARRLLEAGSPPEPTRLEALAALLSSPDPADAVLGARVAGLAAASDDAGLARRGREILRRAAESGAIPAARRALQILVTTSSPETFRQTLERTLEAAPSILDDETIAILAGTPMRRTMAAVFAEVAEALLTGGGRPEAVEGMVRLIVAFGATHPSWYRRLRFLLTRGVLFGASGALRDRAAAAREELEGSFRRWLGPVAHIAVARETGDEYGWDDVVAFDEGVPRAERHRLQVAIKHSPLIREAILLLYGGETVELGDILPGGVWIQPVGRGHGKSVHRVTVQVRGGARYEIAVNLVSDLAGDRQREETDWLILCGDGPADPVVERFGGYWPALQLWTEELIPGDNLETTLERLASNGQEPERFTGFWPYAVWSAAAAFVTFWERTGRRLMVADPEPSNVFVPLHDYHTSARLLSITERAPCASPATLLAALHTRLVDATAHQYPLLRGHASWETLFSAVLEACGEEDGLALLETSRSGLDAGVRPELDRFMETVRREGFRPLRLHFAVTRYARWRRLNPEATPQACARTVQELFSTYGLASLERQYPEARVRFFLETVLAGAPPELAAGLEELIHALRRGTVPPSGIGEAVAALRSSAGVEDEEVDFHLARLSLPHLQPADCAGFAMAPGAETASSDVVVAVRDAEGSCFHIRHALSANEVEALHRIFTAERLQVRFAQRHRFLIAVSETGGVAGGLFYELDPENAAAHMDKIVVAHRFRHKGLATALMEELSNRLLAMGIRTLTTGFFRPQFFYRHGFRIDPHHAGLVKDLQPSGAQATPPAGG